MSELDLQIPVATIVVRAPGPPGPPGVGNTALAGLTDTAGLADATDLQVPAFNADTGEWLPVDQSGGGLDDPDLVAIAAIDSSVAGALATDGAGWFRKTFAQFKTGLSLTKIDVGLSNVDNTSDVNKPVSTATQTALGLKLDASQKGATNGVAELVDGVVPSLQLPSYVDDIIEVANFAALPVTGEASKIYVTINDNKQFRWGGSSYADMGANDLVLGETNTTAYRGDRGKTAYDHSQLTTGNPHSVTKADVGLSNVDNTSDAGKPISSATQTALDNKQAADADLTVIAAVDSSVAGVLSTDGAGWFRKTFAQFKTSLSLVKADVGLSDVDNTSDADKPVSTAQQTALDVKVSKSLFDANTILTADVDDTPQALAVGASTLVGRAAAGNIAALSVATVKGLLALTDEDIQDLIGAMVSGNSESGVTVSYDDTNGKLDFSVSASGGGSPLAGLIGDGSDGAVVLDGTNTFAGFATKSGNTYTLIRDVFATTLQVDAGVTLKTNAWGIFATTSTLNNGTIESNGNSAISATGNSNGNNGVGVSAGAFAGSGAAGGPTTGAGSNGTGLAASLGGSGGAGGAGANAGGAGGVSTLPLVANGRWRNLWALTNGVTTRANTSMVLLTPGCGGGGGGGDGTNRGPGGGAGAGYVQLNTLTLVNNGVISANGGNGAAQTTTGNCGGSGGGGGGVITINTMTAVTGSGSITVDGGAGGAGFGGGAAGSTGSPGSIFQKVWN